MFNFVGAKICDFGLTVSMDNTHISRADGGDGGSPRYMAPELFDPDQKITEKVDIWSLGCILVEIFGGQVPYADCQNMQQLVTKIIVLRERPAVPSFLPLDAQQVVKECFHFDSVLRITASKLWAAMQNPQ